MIDHTLVVRDSANPPSRRYGSSALLGILIALVAVGCARSSQPGEADAMAELHAGDSPMATPMVAEPRVAVTSGPVAYAEIDGARVNGYMAAPEGSAAGLPGVILVHEWWGLNDNITAMARRLAGEGYRVLAVDLYKGRVAETGEMARSYMADAVANPESATTNMRAAAAFLRENHGAPRVAIMGWCFGGAQAANATVAMPSAIDATVIYYGTLPTDREALAAIRGPVVGFFGSEDGGIPTTSVRAFESTMNELGKDVEVTIYEGAGHGFANPSGQAYHEEAAVAAWSRTLAFLSEHVKG